MLYKLQNNIFIYGFLAIGLISCWVKNCSLDLMGVGTIIAFISQMALLLYFTNDRNRNYSEKTLFVVVLLYSMMLGTIFMALSFIYDGDTFMFSKRDAMNYYRDSIRAYDVGFLPNIRFIMKKYDFDDWGSFFYDSFLMFLIPSKYFLNISYMLSGAVTAVLLFRICLYFMPSSYAFIGALAYGTSSYIVFYHCTFLKESLFVAIVVCAMYNFCKLIQKESNSAFLGVAISLAVLFFFRPAVAAFTIMSFSIYYAIKQHGSALSLFLYLGVAVVFLIALQSMTDMADRYSAGGDQKLIESGNGKVYSGGFTTFVSVFGGFFGPFPTLFTKPDSVPTTIQFYSAGLTYKLFLILPFFAGTYLIFKNKVFELFPIIIFILVEMLSTGMVHASLELRKVIPHIPLTYIVSFYGLSKWQDAGIPRRIPESLIYILALGILILWNIVKTT